MYKIGTVIEITQDISGHGFIIGSHLRLSSVLQKGMFWLLAAKRDNRYYWFGTSECKIINNDILKLYENK